MKADHLDVAAEENLGILADPMLPVSSHNAVVKNDNTVLKFLCTDKEVLLALFKAVRWLLEFCILLYGSVLQPSGLQPAWYTTDN